MPGPAPVTIEERQTGVSDGKTDVACRYSPCSARKERAGARPLSTARSKAAGVIPSTTIRTSFLRMRPGLLVAGERPQTGVALGPRPAEPRRQSRQRQRLEVADCRNPRRSRDDDGRTADECRRTAASAAPTERACHDLPRPERTCETADDPTESVDPTTGLPRADAVAERRTDAAGRDRRGDQRRPRRADDARKKHPDRAAEADRDTDPVPRAHAGTVTASAESTLFRRPHRGGLRVP